MSEDPNYLQNLQAQGNAQGLAKLRTLALEFDSVLRVFPAAKQDLERYLASGENVSLLDLVPRVEAQLESLLELKTCIEREYNAEFAASIRFVPENKIESAIKETLLRTTLRGAQQSLAKFSGELEALKTYRLEEEVFYGLRDECISVCRGVFSFVTQAIYRLENVSGFATENHGGEKEKNWREFRHQVFKYDFEPIARDIPDSFNRIGPDSKDGAGVVEEAVQIAQRFQTSAGSLLSRLQSCGNPALDEVDRILLFASKEVSRFCEKSSRLRQHFLGEME